MNPQRQKLYQKLEERIGNTSLVKYKGTVPNRNNIWIKRECDNPYGSHYDRVYIALFRDFEERGKIKSGSNVLETTSGTAGISFAGIGKELRFNCYVALYTGGEKAREKAIKELISEDRLILTSAEEYLAGFPTEVAEFLIKKTRQGEDLTYINSSMGLRDKETTLPTNNEITLSALGNIAREIRGIKIDYFIPAIKSGSSLLGVARVLNNTKVIGFETFQSPVVYNQFYQYTEKFGIELPKVSGTSGIDFPHIRNAINSSYLDDVVLVSDKSRDKEYFESTERRDTKILPHWDAIKYEDVGRTTLAGIAVALDIAKKVKGKNFLVIAYDKADRYDSLFLKCN